MSSLPATSSVGDQAAETLHEPLVATGEGLLGHSFTNGILGKLAPRNFVLREKSELELLPRFIVVRGGVQLWQ